MSVDILHRYTGAILYHSDLLNVREALVVAVRSGANLARANLARANLARADLARADLAGADLARANLAGANLAGANLAGANLARANLARANLAGANLAGASGLNPLLVDDLRTVLHDQAEITAYKLVDSELRSPMGFGVLTYAIGAELLEPGAGTDETVQCACGLNVGTFSWCLRNWKSGWRILRVLHSSEDIAAIPLGTDGKWRVRKLRVLAEVPMNEWGEGPWSPAPPTEDNE